MTHDEECDLPGSCRTRLDATSLGELEARVTRTLARFQNAWQPAVVGRTLTSTAERTCCEQAGAL